MKYDRIIVRSLPFLLGVILLPIGVITVLQGAPKLISVWILIVAQLLTNFSIVKEDDNRNSNT
nr:MAG TPA: hypothetical protein [Caudoviricetes sp.]